MIGYMADLIVPIACAIGLTVMFALAIDPHRTIDQLHPKE